MHGAIGGIAVIGLIAFAFGQRTAQYIVGAGLILGAAGCLWVAYMIATRVLQ